jgi:hypothetical protein
MKKLIIAAAITTLFSTMASANSGLADRISDERSSPNREAKTLNSKALCVEHKKLHEKMSRVGMNESPHKLSKKCSDPKSSKIS